jgi:pyridoxine 5-phosphate synthase
MASIGADLKPMTVTLVPERREEITTEGGLDLGSPAAVGRVRDAVRLLHDSGVRTSLFIDPSIDDIAAASELGADAIELHTGSYANQWRGARRSAGADDELSRLARAAARGASVGLAVHAGHGLTYENVAPLAAIEEIEELNIGHSVVSRALLVGMERAVAEMKKRILGSRN